MSAYQVVAQNFSEDHENKIHSDEIAKKYGFKGGLVPGVAVWGHLTHPLVERLGEETHLVRAVRANPLGFLPPAEASHGVGQALHRAGDASRKECRKEKRGECREERDEDYREDERRSGDGCHFFEPVDKGEVAAHVFEAQESPRGQNPPDHDPIPVGAGAARCGDE